MLHVNVLPTLRCDVSYLIAHQPIEQCHPDLRAVPVDSQSAVNESRKENGEEHKLLVMCRLIDKRNCRYWTGGNSIQRGRTGERYDSISAKSANLKLLELKMFRVPSSTQSVIPLQSFQNLETVVPV